MAEEAPQYDELRVRFHPTTESSHRTVATAADESTASATFENPFSDLELDNFVLRVGRQRLPLRSYHSSQMEEARRVGERLFDALMIGGVRDVFRSARSAAEHSGRGLRLTLCLSDAPQLMDLPWEFLYEKPRFLSQSIFTPIARSLDLVDAPTPYPVSLPLNVIGMVSSPNGFATLDVEREKSKLSEALQPLCQAGVVNLEWLETGTLRELDEVINQPREIHVFHFIGHGGYSADQGNGILVLENERGEPAEVSGQELGLLLQDERSMSLAVLNSCEGARSSHVDPFSGAATSLVHYGVPAVIGMQFEITDEAAIAFAGRLYASLAHDFPVDAALAQARRSIFAAGNDVEFGTPVLFLRGHDAQVFGVLDEIEPPEPVAPPPPAEPELTYVEEFTGPPEIEADFTQAPKLRAWLPRPWQEWWFELRSDLPGTLGRIPTRLLVLGGIVLAVTGTVITTWFSGESQSGKHESLLGAILVAIGSIALWTALVRGTYRKFRFEFRRIRHWWTGDR